MNGESIFLPGKWEIFFFYDCIISVPSTPIVSAESHERARSYFPAEKELNRGQKRLK